jgi:hypothetical protein
MGYRSDVAYTIRFVHEDDTNNKQSFYTFLAEAKAKAATAACFTEEQKTWQGGNGFIVDEGRFRINFSAEHVKWYPDFDDVKCHMALIDLAAEWANDEDNNSGIAYVFVRIGEENDDVEEEFGGDYDWSWMSVNRSIERDW